MISDCFIAVGFRVVALSVRIRAADVPSYMPRPPVIAVPSECRMRVITRLTLCLEDQATIYKVMQNPVLKEYDLMAVEPLNDKILNQISSGSLEPDVVTFDLSQRLPVDMKRANLKLPISRGVCFEICFTQAFTGQSSRANTFSSAQLLVDKTKGKNVIISSGAKTCINMRGPYDAAAIGLLFGMKELRCKESVFRSGDTCIRHAECRKNSSLLAVSVGCSLDDPKDKMLEMKLSHDDSKIDEKDTSDVPGPTPAKKRRRKRMKKFKS